MPPCMLFSSLLLFSAPQLDWVNVYYKSYSTIKDINTLYLYYTNTVRTVVLIYNELDKSIALKMKFTGIIYLVCMQCSICCSVQLHLCIDTYQSNFFTKRFILLIFWLGLLCRGHPYSLWCFKIIQYASA